MGEHNQQKKEELIQNKATFLITLFLVLFYFAAGIHVQSQPLNYVPEELSASNILGFAKSRAAAGDFYRAAVELDRLKGYYPNYLTDDLFLVSKYYYLFNGAQYSTLLFDYNSRGRLFRQLDIFAADSLFAGGEYYAMDKLLENNYADSSFPYHEMVFKRCLLAGLFTENEERLASLEKLYAVEYSAYKELIDSTAADLSKRKKPFLAAALGLFPGGGYAYAGNVNTGLVALVVVSLSGILSYTAYNNGSKLPAFFLGTVGTLFYGGSIIGGYLSAIKFNRALREDVARNCSQALSIPQDRETLYMKYGIGGRR